MELLTKELIQELLTADQSPCLSLYMPTHRKHPENIQDIILFKNLVRQLKISLLQKYSASEVQKYLEPFEDLADDNSIWKHAIDGLAVFSTTGLFKVVGVQKSF
jgi:hypothetical protein